MVSSDWSILGSVFIAVHLLPQNSFQFLYMYKAITVPAHKSPSRSWFFELAVAVVAIFACGFCFSAGISRVYLIRVRLLCPGEENHIPDQEILSLWPGFCWV
jgi:hypothetical protein